MVILLGAGNPRFSAFDPAPDDVNSEVLVISSELQVRLMVDHWTGWIRFLEVANPLCSPDGWRYFPAHSSSQMR